MKVFTVVHVWEGDVTPFAQCYATKDRAIQAVEASALEDFECMVDPNDGDVHKFPGLDWNKDMDKAWVDENDDDAGWWLIVEAELKD